MASKIQPDLKADKARALALHPVSRETEARLDRFAALLVEWQAKTNLVAPSTLPNLWTRHIADSLQLLRLAPDAKAWIDLGSGGGFPGLVIACALAEAGGRIHLVESNGKKAAFLREAARVTGVPAQIHAVRIEDFVDSFREAVDAVTARALAPLDMLLGYAQPLLARGGRALLLKGQDVEAELTEATKYWNMQDIRLEASRTDPHGRIVVVRGISRKANGALGQ